MRQWSEVEVFSLMTDLFRKTASACDDLAKRQRHGPVYNTYRNDLQRLEGMCRIAGYMRQDTRWLYVAQFVHKAHEMAGDWLRGVPRKPDAQGRPQPAMRIPDGELHPLFVKLGEFLRSWEKVADDLRTKATGRIGPILPRMLEPPVVRQPTNYRVKLPGLDGLRRTDGGIILPRRAVG